MFGLYIHIPFCRKKCNYCDFYSEIYKDSQITDYIKALCLEMTKYKKHKIETIYIGGGTPSLISVNQLKLLCKNVKNIFNLDYLKEWTIESNPESLTYNKLINYYKSGINRLSIGAQSFNNNELKFLGRIHNSNDIFLAFIKARKAGFNNINLDLIYGLPDQTLKQWQINLNKITNLKPKHISIYPLTIETNTPFNLKKVEVSQDNQANMYNLACKFLETKGYKQYEISNFAKPGYECKHNLKYWSCKQYIGIGASACSYLNGYRRKNYEDIKKYVQSVNSDNITVEEEEIINEKTRLSEKIILNLRCNKGILLTDKIKNNYMTIFNNFISQKLIEKKNDNIRLTQKGRLLSNRIFMEFV